MPTTPLQVAVIIGSTREGRFGGTVAEWFVDRARLRDDMVLDVIDLVDVELPMALPLVSAPAAAAFVERIGRADAFVVITPEYNHGYPASLKQAIDLPRDEWREKPVGFVSYGGVSAGTRSVQQLKSVVTAVGMVPVITMVNIPFVGQAFDQNGRFETNDVMEKAAKALLDEPLRVQRLLRTAGAEPVAQFGGR